MNNNNESKSGIHEVFPDISSYISLPTGHMRDTFISTAGLEYLKLLGPVRLNRTDHYQTPKEYSEVIRRSKALFTGWGAPKIDKEFLDYMPRLMVIAHLGGSVADVFTEEVWKRGIIVLSANRVFARAVSEACVLYMLYLLRDIRTYERMVRDGGWRGDDFSNRSLFRKKVGLLGFGTSAMYLGVHLRQSFDCNIMAWDPYIDSEVIKSSGHTPASPADIFAECDIVSVHLALTPFTTGFVGAELLSKMRDGSILINTSRGKVIDEAALIDVLKTGRISAALDVFEREPLDPDSPLRTLDNVLAIPHMAGPTTDLRAECFHAMVRELDAFRHGEQLIHQISYDHFTKMTTNNI